MLIWPSALTAPFEVTLEVVFGETVLLMVPKVITMLLLVFETALIDDVKEDAPDCPCEDGDLVGQLLEEVVGDGLECGQNEEACEELVE